MVQRRLRLALCAGLAALLSACSAAPAAVSATPHARSPAATVVPAVTPSPGLSACPAPRAFDLLDRVRVPVADPDDITAMPNGDLWVSDNAGGHLVLLSPAGAPLQTIADGEAPEGVVVLPDGTTLVAQQAPDRIDRLDAATGRFTAWLQLRPRNGVEGVDGIALDAGAVLVPDSARGDVETVAIGAGDVAGPARVDATGLGRPVDAVPDGAGGVVVALENRPGLVDVSAQGAVRDVASFASLDDIVLVHGLVYATDLANHAVRVIDPASGVSRVLVTGVDSPQGLTLASDGRLVVIDSTTRVVAWLNGCG